MLPKTAQVFKCGTDIFCQYFIIFVKLLTKFILLSNPLPNSTLQFLSNSLPNSSFYTFPYNFVYKMWKGCFCSSIFLFDEQFSGATYFFYFYHKNTDSFFHQTYFQFYIVLWSQKYKHIKKLCRYIFTNISLVIVINCVFSLTWRNSY